MDLEQIEYCEINKSEAIYASLFIVYILAFDITPPHNFHTNYLVHRYR